MDRKLVSFVHNNVESSLTSVTLVRTLCLTFKVYQTRPKGVCTHKYFLFAKMINFMLPRENTF